MRASRRRWGLWVIVLALGAAAPALAQENIDAGKTPAQLYAQDCAICHKTPHGLSKAGGLWGLQNFLREHYTASKESAAAIAAYLGTIDRGAPPHQRARAGRRVHKGEKSKAKAEKTKKSGEAKLPPGKPPEAKAKADAKSGTKSGSKSEAKSGAKSEKKSEKKPDKKPDKKPSEAKAAPAPKPVEAKSEAKTEVKTDVKTDGAKAPGGKPEKKTD